MVALQPMSEFPNYKRRDPSGFQRVVNQRIEEYFANHKQFRGASARLWLKAIILFAVYLGPIYLILNEGLTVWAFYGLWVISGLGMAGIGMNVMHDAIHGSWSEKSWLNKLLGSSIYLLGGHPFTWRVQHNFLHHQYTNLKGLDEDVEVRGLVRLHHEEPLKPMHKWQSIYAPLLYGLLTLNWSLTKDITQMMRYTKLGLLKRFKMAPSKAWRSLIIGKLVYFAVFLIVPLIFAPYAWYLIVTGWLLKHFIAGSVLSFVFQLAHIVGDAEQPSWEGDSLDSGFMEHQLRTTANFSRKSFFVTWYTGGLNYQVEHHLFPHISHAHYPKIASIVKQTAQEFNLPYNEQSNFGVALIDHFKTLHRLGNVV
jgi:linoleoyl-CoA desaturase